MSGTFKSFENRVQIKSINEAKKTVQTVISSIEVDRDEEIILPRAFEKRIGNYLANPVLCWGHPLSDWIGTKCVPENLIGRALEVLINDIQVSAEFEYAVDRNPRARLCWELVAGGFMKAYSIGAMTYDYTFFDDSEEELKKLPPFAYEALKSGSAYLAHTDMELLETSQVFVGSNRQALSKALKDGTLSRKDFRCLVEGGEVERKILVPVEADLKKDAALTVEPVKVQPVLLQSAISSIKAALVDLESLSSSESGEEDESAKDVSEPELCPDCGDPMDECSCEKSKAAILADLEEMKKILSST